MKNLLFTPLKHWTMVYLNSLRNLIEKIVIMYHYLRHTNYEFHSISNSNKNMLLSNEYMVKRYISLAIRHKYCDKYLIKYSQLKNVVTEEQLKKTIDSLIISFDLKQLFFLSPRYYVAIGTLKCENLNNEIFINSLSVLNSCDSFVLIYDGFINDITSIIPIPECFNERIIDEYSQEYSNILISMQDKLYDYYFKYIGA